MLVLKHTIRIKTGLATATNTKKGRQKYYNEQAKLNKKEYEALEKHPFVH